MKQEIFGALKIKQPQLSALGMEETMPQTHSLRMH
jgi:hypothetical protein